MQEKENRNIEEATQRVKERMPLEKIWRIPKYRDITSEGYERLMKDAETVALLANFQGVLFKEIKNLLVQYLRRFFILNL